MKFPFLNKEYPLGFRFKEKYPEGWGSLTGKPHLGIDIICPRNTPIVAWKKLEIIRAFFGEKGGYTLWVKDGNFVLRFLHLEEMPPIVGWVDKGDIMAYTGNSGASTTPHVHNDASRNRVILNINNFVNPETYYKKRMKKFTVKPYYLGDKNRNTFLQESKDYYSEFVNLDIQPMTKVSKVYFDYNSSYGYGLVPNPIKFLKENPTKEDIAVIVVDSELWKSYFVVYGIEYSFPDTKVIFVQGFDHTSYDRNATFSTMLHELRHALVSLSETGIRDDTHDIVKETPRNQKINFLKNLDTFYIINNKDMILTSEQVKKLYLAVFHREADESGLKEYTGKTLDYTLNDFLSSEEHRKYDPVNKSVKEIENWARK